MMDQVLATSDQDRAAATLNKGTVSLVDAATPEALEAAVAVNPTVALLSDLNGQMVSPEFVLAITLDIEGTAMADVDAAELKLAKFDNKSLYNPFSKKPTADAPSGPLAGFVRAPLVRIMRSLSELNKAPVFILGKPAERLILEKSIGNRVAQMAAAEIGVPLTTEVVVGDKTLTLADFISFMSWVVTSKQDADEEVAITTTFLNIRLVVPALLQSSNPIKFIKTINGIIGSLMEKNNVELTTFVNVSMKAGSFAMSNVRSLVDSLVEENGYELSSLAELYANQGESWVPATKKAIDEMMAGNDILLYCAQTNTNEEEAEDDDEDLPPAML